MKSAHNALEAELTLTTAALQKLGLECQAALDTSAKELAARHRDIAELSRLLENRRVVIASAEEKLRHTAAEIAKFGEEVRERDACLEEANAALEKKSTEWQVLGSSVFSFGFSLYNLHFPVDLRVSSTA